MKPPRYLLREAMLLRMLKPLPPGNFLEIGYGSGALLLTLAQRGYWGDGYDFSADAEQAARALLEKNEVSKVRLLSELKQAAGYDYLFFFEVIGYWKNPSQEISGLKTQLKNGGRLFFSFTSKHAAGFAEKVTGDMNCFTREDIIDMVSQDQDLSIEAIWNYGFPLANCLKPLLNLYHFVRSKTRSQDIETDIRQSGLAGRSAIIRLASFLINPITIYPFAKLQFFFRNTDLGTGYLVMVRRR